MITSLIISLFTLASAADLDESFNCKGTLIVQRNFGKEASRANDGIKSFSFSRKDTNSVAVYAPEGKDPLVVIFPWDGIHSQVLAKGKLAKDIKVETDRDQSFEVSVKKDKENYDLYCRIFE